MELPVYHSLEQVDQAVTEAVAREKIKGRRQLRPVLRENTISVLANGVKRVLERFSEKYGNFMFTFGSGQNPQDWQLDVYCEGIREFEFLDFIEDIIEEDELRKHHFHAFAVPREDYEGSLA